VSQTELFDRSLMLIEVEEQDVNDSNIVDEYQQETAVDMQ
jgi:hypothetical protein